MDKKKRRKKPPKPVTYEEARIAIERAMFYFLRQQQWYGSLLQELNLTQRRDVPYAAIHFDPSQMKYTVSVNPDTFSGLKVNEAVGVLHHEILHFTHQHLTRIPFDPNSTKFERSRINIAMDMAINQFIPVLPKGCVNYKDWKLDDGSVFPALQTAEIYDELLKKEFEKQSQPAPSNDKGDGEGKEEGESDGEGDCNGRTVNGRVERPGTQGTVFKQMSGYTPMDSHDWEQLDEDTKKKMLEAAKDAIKRTIEKTSYNSSLTPGYIRDVIQNIDAAMSGLNHKQLLKSVIKKTVSCADREGTWNRPNKRYGVYSPGTKIGMLPNLAMYLDSSGSISYTEFCTFLKIVSGFLKAGNRNCWLALWHTEMYYKKKYKLNSKLDESVLQSGGTDVSAALTDIMKSRPNLSIILTDGYYEQVDLKPSTEVIWIISKGGNLNHPMKHIGKTIELEKLA